MPGLRRLIVTLGLLMSVNAMACGNDMSTEEREEAMKIVYNQVGTYWRENVDYKLIATVAGGIAGWFFVFGAGIHWYLKD